MNNLTIYDLIQHFTPDISVEIYTQDECKFIKESSVAGIGLSTDKWYRETIVQSWLVYGSYVRIWV